MIRMTQHERDALDEYLTREQETLDSDKQEFEKLSDEQDEIERKAEQQDNS